jgi:hypothetical protein
MIRTAAFSAFVATGLLVSGILAGTLAYHPSTSHATASSVSTTASLSSSTVRGLSSANTITPAANGRGGKPGSGNFGRGFGGFRGAGGAVLTVTGVSNNTITATGRGGQTITVTVTNSTKYSEAGAAAQLSDVVKGEHIAVQGSRSGTSITATSITIVLPVVSGVISNLSSDSFTITGFNGATHAIHIGSSTRYQRAGAAATVNDVANGSAVVVEGTLNSDGSVNAVRITIQVPQVAGQVTAVNSNGYTITSRGGTAVTVITSSATTYITPSGGSTPASTIVKNSVILVQGGLSADGKTINALRIVVLPAGGPRHFGRGGHGAGPGLGGGFPLATPTPTSGI